MEMARELETIAGEASQWVPKWGPAHTAWGRVIAEKECRIGAELGVAYGLNAERMLQNPAIDKLYGVDPYPDWNYSSEAMLRYVCERLAPFGDRYQHIFMYADDAIDFVPNELDFIYIDHDHSYPGMMRCFFGWLPKLRAGGVFGGDGYCGQVQTSVDDFCEWFSWQVVEAEAKVWWVEKKC